MKQVILKGWNNINFALKEVNAKKLFLVCDKAFESLKDSFLQLNVPYIQFSNFTSNPLYEDVYKAVKLYKDEKCDSVIAIGGGSAIDVAKCVKLFCNMDTAESYLYQEYIDTNVPLIALPATAGTGSESTKYAVIYYNEKKLSITHESIIPNYAILEPELLKTLPQYQKICTSLDALCQGIESWWSLNSTEESKKYSKYVVQTISQNIENYIFANDYEAAKNIMYAANYSGQAINITQTTAAHAMSYKLTSIYSIPHGHAVAICLPKLWKYMIDNIHNCIDPRGEKYIFNVFTEISHSLGAISSENAIKRFEEILKKMNIHPPDIKDTKHLDILANSVDALRLSNNPIQLNTESLYTIYKSIFE